MMMRVANISYRIDKKVILSNCSLDVLPGVFTAIVGPNGAGKTSLLRIMTGEISRYSGKVDINGIDTRRIRSRELSKVRAVLPQHTVVNFPFSVEKIVETGRFPHLTTRRENAAIIDEILGLTSLTDFKHRIYQTLSGGEQQRVQMARVMAQIWDRDQDPRYLLLDEPTASLDLAQQHFILHLAKQICSRNIGLVAIIHDLNLASQYADQILFLRNGDTVAIGDVRTTMTKEVVEETFSYPVRILCDVDTNRPVFFPATLSTQHQKSKNNSLKVYTYE